MLSNDTKERDGSEHKMMTWTLFTLEHLEPSESALKFNVTQGEKCALCPSGQEQKEGQ